MDKFEYLMSDQGQGHAETFSPFTQMMKPKNQNRILILLCLNDFVTVGDPHLAFVLKTPACVISDFLCQFWRKRLFMMPELGQRSSSTVLPV